MEYGLIFYTARKTAYCETALQRAMEKSSITPQSVCAAVTPQSLNTMVNDVLRKLPILILVGDIGRNDENSLTMLVSRGFAGGKENFTVQRLWSVNGTAGYMLKGKNKTVLCLPDSPEDIERLLDIKVTEFIKAEITK